MERCPELADLEAFFGAAAASAYGNEGGGWYYDRLTFRHVEADTEITCTLEAAERAFSVAHSRAGTELLGISLQHVVALDIESSAGVQVLIGRVASPGLEQLFKLRLSPAFSFSLVTQLPTYG